MSRNRVLIAEPDPFARELLRVALENEGCAAVSARHTEEALELLRERLFDVLLADRTSGGDALLVEARAQERGPAVILTDAIGSISSAVDAIRRGAVDYLAKPAGEEQMLLAVRRALERRSLTEENRLLRASLGERYELANLITRDPRMRAVFQTVEAVADAGVNLLIEGESGTGKTMLARAVHQRSSRRRGPFVDVNCGALPQNLLESELFGHKRGSFTGAVGDRAGKFEAADGGTLFLDEIATASPDLQVKLLRVLEDQRFTPVGAVEPREVDVRVIAAANRDLSGEVAAGRFREDLYYRIHVVSIELPPLRERPADVPLLVERFLERFRAQYARPAERLSSAARDALLAHPWPGNVRQLEHCLERAVLLCPGAEIRLEDLGEEFAAPAARGPEPTVGGAEPPLGPLKSAMEGPEQRFLLRALEHCDGSRKRTAALLGINRTTLFNKMKKYKLLGFPARTEAP